MVKVELDLDVTLLWQLCSESQANASNVEDCSQKEAVNQVAQLSPVVVSQAILSQMEVVVH